MNVEKFLEHIDIVDFLSNYTELVEKNGEFWGLSPLADPPEKTPSFSVRRETGTFYCFSTGIGGTLITFLKKYYNTSGFQAVEILKNGFSGEIDFNNLQRLKSVDIINKFSKKRQTKNSKGGGVVLPKDFMDRYEGFETARKELSIWIDEGIGEEILLTNQVKFDRVSKRIVYPILDLEGNIVNIGGRAIFDFKTNGGKKYCYFYQWKDGCMNTIFGYYKSLQDIKESGEVIIFEGAKSVFLANTWGIKNACALLTSHLSPFQMKALAKLGVRVVFALDKDIDITASETIKSLKRYVPVYYLNDVDNVLSDKDSPVDKGRENFIKMYESKRRLK